MQQHHFNAVMKEVSRYGNHTDGDLSSIEYRAEDNEKDGSLFPSFLGFLNGSGIVQMLTDHRSGPGFQQPREPSQSTHLHVQRGGSRGQPRPLFLQGASHNRRNQRIVGDPGVGPQEYFIPSRTISFTHDLLSLFSRA